VPLRERALKTTLKKKMTAAKPAPIQKTGGIAANPSARNAAIAARDSVSNCVRALRLMPGRNRPIGMQMGSR
jgi:hypothetical protein